MPDSLSQRHWEPTASFPSPAGAALVLGRYRMLEPIGSGGMGRVFKALHVHLKHQVAIKTIDLDPRRGQHSALIERFRREMEAIGAIQHTHVVRATDGGEENGTCYLVMEYVPGTDLALLVQKLGPLHAADACELIRQAADGLACIHASGLVHRDIKPSNLLLSKQVLKIADLGLARFRNAAAGHDELTPDGQALGTPDYMAPEQAQNARTADIRADIYSLGCSLFRLLTGQPPYPSSQFATYAEKLLAHQQQPIPCIRDTRAALGLPEQGCDWPAVDAVLQRMLAKDPAARFSTPDEAAAALAPLAKDSDLAALWRCWQGEMHASSTPGHAETDTSNPSHALTPNSGAMHTDAVPAVGQGRWIALMSAGAVALALLIAMAIGSGLFGRADRAPAITEANKKPAPAPALTLDELPELRWHKLLEAAPRVVHWPRGEGLADWRHDANLQQLTLQSSNLGLLELGTTQSPHYILSIGLMQNRWSGGVGVYLGCQLPDVEGGSGRLQFLELREERGRGNKRQMNLTRGFLELSRGKNGELVALPTSCGSQEIQDVHGEQTLEVTVADGLLRRLRINGVEMRGVVESSVNVHFTAADHRGGFGVIVDSSDGVFRNAQFMRLNEAP